jgi:hypothetical protein
MASHRRTLWNRDGRTHVNGLNQLCCDWLAGLRDAQAFFEPAPKIATGFDRDHIL